MNIFWLRKQISAISGPVDVEIEAPANGTLILKTTSRVQTRALLKITAFCVKQVTVSLHQSRNSCKGTIFAPELRRMSEDEILADLRGDGGPTSGASRRSGMVSAETLTYRSSRLIPLRSQRR